MQMKHCKGTFKAQADLCRVSFTVWKATAEGCLLWERKCIVKAYEGLYAVTQGTQNDTLTYQ